MKKKIFFSLAVFLLAFFIAGAAKGAGNLQGWLWGGNDGTNLNGTIIGTTNLEWISMNSSNCDSNNDSKSDGTGECPSAGTEMANYGVNIPTIDGDVSGYAWSQNLGWIDFEPQNHCDKSGGYSADSCTDPDEGTGGVSRSGDYLQGWARFVSIAEASAIGNSGGWEGWISMSGTNYGVSVDNDGTLCKIGDPKTDAAGRCFAWSNELGWIDFSRVSIVPGNNPPIVEALPDGGEVVIGNNATISCGSTYDPEGDSLTYQWTQINGPAVVINNSDRCTASFTAGPNVGDKYEFNLSVNDGNNSPVSDQADVTSAAVPCLCNTGCEVNTCEGDFCNDSCGNPVCPGTKDCADGTNWREVAP